MRFTTCIIGHAYFSVAMLQHIIEFVEARLSARKRFAVDLVDLLAIKNNRLNTGNRFS
ncbi:hypothetical protein VVORL1506_04147 [Vibrio vulnificus]|nr:hypothetical protein VVORL1506_04147 [Vibrio vulnificus]